VSRIHAAPEFVGKSLAHRSYARNDLLLCIAQFEIHIAFLPIDCADIPGCESGLNRRLSRAPFRSKRCPGPPFSACHQSFGDSRFKDDGIYLAQPRFIARIRPIEGDAQ
jgi:hypothetical protein